MAKREYNTGTNKGYLRITCDGEPAADVFPFAAGRDPSKVTERAKEMVATLNGFAHQGLIDFLETVTEHLDREAEGGVIIHDPADLYAGGIACLKRLQRQPQR